MDDLKLLKDLFTQLGIEYTEVSDSENITIICEYGKRKIEGNQWCASFFDFDLTGRFICMGAYER